MKQYINSFFKISIIMIALFYSENLFCQNNLIEVKQLRFKTEEFKDIISSRIKEFKKVYKLNPKTIIISLYEEVKKIQDDNYQYVEKKDLIIQIEITVNYFSIEDDIKWFGRDFTKGMTFEDTTILLRDSLYSKIENELFFVDPIKISVPSNLGGNEYSLKFEYYYKNYNFKFIKNYSEY